MIILFSVIYTVLLMFLLITLVNALTGPYLKKSPNDHPNPRVSVLVPARNEERNIKNCLESLQKQNYPDFEIILLDDESQDNTLAIAESVSRDDHRIRIISGNPLPSGWTGKNWACHQLSKQATGEIIIFTDADNRHAPTAITKTVAWMNQYSLDLLSAFPQQITRSLFEKVIVPVVDMFLYSFLPLWLTYYLPFPSLAAANGQWIAFLRKSYQKMGGHAEVRKEIVEDVELSRMAKRKKYKIMTLSGNGVIFGHMYSSFKEVWEGFTKNLFGLVAHQTFLFILIQFLLLIIYILPYLLLFIPQYLYAALVAVGLGLTIRIILILGFRHPPVVSIILHPFSILLTMLIGFNSILKFKAGKIVWKSRKIST